MSVRAVVAIGVVALIVGLAVLLGHSAPRQAGTNSIVEAGQVIELRGDDRHCQPGETAPRDAARLRLLVGTYGHPVPTLRVTVRGEAGHVLTEGTKPAGGREGHVVIPLRKVEKTTPGTEVCIATSGGQRMVLYGQPPNIRLEWLRPGEESWYALVPTVAHRFALGKAALFGSLWLVFAGLLVLAAALIAVRVILRETEERP
jgi:hypothetical protein